MATNGPDTIIGTDGADTINGLGGNDVIYGMSGVNNSPIAGRITAKLVGTGFSGAVAAVTAPGDPNHLYVLTKDDGVIHRLDPTTRQSTVFLNIPDNEFSSGGERGVLAVAFHPDYANMASPNHGRFFVYLTNPSGDIEVREYDSDNSPIATPVKTIITIPHQDAANHNGGSLAFGPNDGYLYISTGDGTSGSDVNDSGQNLTDLQSVMMRLDVDHPDPGRNYSIPRDNPFLNTPGALPEIWAYGFRNPWRFSFDPQTGEPWVGDVGQDLWEMIELSHSGANHGWSVMEGSHPFQPGRQRPEPGLGQTCRPATVLGELRPGEVVGRNDPLRPATGPGVGTAQ